MFLRILILTGNYRQDEFEAFLSRPPREVNMDEAAFVASINSSPDLITLNHSDLIRTYSDNLCSPCFDTKCFIDDSRDDLV